MAAADAVSDREGVSSAVTAQRQHQTVQKNIKNALNLTALERAQSAGGIYHRGKKRNPPKNLLKTNEMTIKLGTVLPLKLPYGNRSRGCDDASAIDSGSSSTQNTANSR